LIIISSKLREGVNDSQKLSCFQSIVEGPVGLLDDGLRVFLDFWEKWAGDPFIVRNEESLMVSLDFWEDPGDT
jgi:hypothetical protein